MCTGAMPVRTSTLHEMNIPWPACRMESMDATRVIHTYMHGIGRVGDG